MIKRTIVFTISILLLSTSCNKFLDEYSQNLVYASSAQDLNELLIGECFRSLTNPTIYSPVTMDNAFYYPWLHVMDDDAEEFVSDFVSADNNTALHMLAGSHHWQREPFVNGQNIPYSDDNWHRLYKSVAVLNSVIYQADALKGKDDAQRLTEIKGEAYFLRALNYFTLANIYGPPFQKATAAEDLCIPLKITPNVEDKFFTRTPAATVYGQIIADLQNAKVCLKDAVPTSDLHVSTAAVEALLSRIYLYTEDYAAAIGSADSVLLSSGYSILDLNRYVPGSNFTYRSSPETIFTMIGYAIPAIFVNDSTSQWNGNDNRVSAFKASADLLNTFDVKDLRLQAFFYRAAKSGALLPLKYRTASNMGETISDDYLIRLPEVLLNKAEACAMLGQENEAKTVLEQLRSKRFRPGDLQPVTATGAGLVDFIRAERRRELCFEGHRWFDLRRYSVNSKYPLPASFTIHHPTYSYNANINANLPDGYYELKSYKLDKAAWVVPIPNEVIEFNQGSLSNEVRTDRQPIK